MEKTVFPPFFTDTIFFKVGGVKKYENSERDIIDEPSSQSDESLPKPLIFFSLFKK